MQALLYAVGVGAGSVPLAAAINWILKDGLGQLGGVVYGAKYGDSFDVDPKRHRLLSTAALQAATLLEVSGMPRCRPLAFSDAHRAGKLN